MSDQALAVLRAVVDDDTPTGDDESTAPERSAPVEDHFVFSSRLRSVTIGYVLVSVPVLVVLFWSPTDPVSYLRLLFTVGAIYYLPAALLALIGALRAPAADRLVRWLWAVTVTSGAAGAILTVDRLQPGIAPSMARMVTPVVIGLVILVVANTLMMRSRSGQRAALVDSVDLIMATMALTVPLALAFGTQIANSPVPWFTVAAAFWAVISIHGTMIALVIRTRLEPGHRIVAELGIVFGATAAFSSVCQTILGVNNFSVPAGPFVGMHALTLGIGAIFFSYMRREPSPGLERFAPVAQVRRNSMIAVLVLFSTPILAAIVWWRQEENWVQFAGLTAMLTLIALSSLRHLLAARETTRLYSMVERSAQERGELLSDMMAHADIDRHRAATHLHRQAASLYTAMASFSAAITQASESGDPAAVSFAAERLRRDLGQRADGLRRFAEALTPLTPADEEARRLAAPIRAFLENLTGDNDRPDLHIDVDPELTLDWTTEAVVLRILQAATLTAWWHAKATSVSITVSADHDSIHVEILDDGKGDPPAPLTVSSMQSVARFLGGELTATRRCEGGNRVHATIPFAMTLPDANRPHLSIVEPTQ